MKLKKKGYVSRKIQLELPLYSLRPKKNDILAFKIYSKKNDVLYANIKSYACIICGVDLVQT